MPLVHKNNFMKLLNLNLYFSFDTRFDRVPKTYEIKKKYIKYLNTNRNLYKNFNLKKKQNIRFFKKHIPLVSKLSLKSRIHLFEYSLLSLILKLKYAYSNLSALFFIKSGLIFINGVQSFNWQRYLYKGDCLEFIYSTSFFKFNSIIKKKLDKSLRKYKKQNWKLTKNKVNFEKKYINLLKLSKRVFFF